MPGLDEDTFTAPPAVGAMPDSHSDWAEQPSDIALLHSDRYFRKGEGKNLEKAIQMAKQALELAEDLNSDEAPILSNLGVLLSNMYTRRGEKHNLEEAIRFTRLSVQATSKTNPLYAARLSNLGLQLGDLYSKTRDEHTLKEALQITKEAVETMPEAHKALPIALNALALQLGNLYSRTNTITHLDEAVEKTRQAFKMTPSTDPNKNIWANNLGVWLGSRYSRTGNLRDLEESIDVLRQLLDTTPKEDPNCALRLNSLGIRLSVRYEVTGAVVDLDEAIQVTDTAIKGTPDDHPNKVKWLNNLSNHHGFRYLRIGALSDLEYAIQLSKSAVALSRRYHSNHPKHPDLGIVLNNLGSRLGDRYLRTGEMDNIREAIQVTREAVKTADSDALKASSLSHLGHLLGSRYVNSGAIGDLDEAIQFARESICLTPEKDQSLAGRLGNLSLQLSKRYATTAEMNCLEEAIQFARDAVKITLPNQPDRAKLLYYLGNQLSNRYSSTKDAADLDKAISCYQSALGQTSSSTITRIQSGAAILRISPDWEQAHVASSIAVGLISKLTSRSFDIPDKQRALLQVVGLASDAAAAALRVNKPPLVALQLLEQGRNILGASLEEMRGDMTELKARHPTLAEQVTSLREELETPVASGAHILESSTPTPPTGAQISRRYAAGKEYDELVDKIRRLTGFHDFLAPPSNADILTAARHGPIVVVNISKYRCDAILVEKDRIRLSTLNNISREEIEIRSQKGTMGSLKTLEWLWNAVAHPVLRDLGFLQPPPSDSWPRIWWIPIGPLSKFPLHAAGYHRTHSSETVLDRVISSYSSSIKVMVYESRRRHVQLSTSDQALLIAMDYTPQHDPLPFAAKEICILHRLCESMSLEVFKSEPCRPAVLRHLQTCRVFHFAGHGHTDRTDPSNSYLYLEDWEKAPLKVADLLSINLRKHSPFLAYLSACGTGQIKDEGYVDESIHLISAFQLAGFRHVIGTLWKVNDKYCQDMAHYTYESIKDGGMKDTSVSRGLHSAARRLRAHWVRSGPERYLELEKDKESQDETTPNWVPYVHFGT